MIRLSVGLEKLEVCMSFVKKIKLRHLGQQIAISISVIIQEFSPKLVSVFCCCFLLWQPPMPTDTLEVGSVVFPFM